MLVDTHCHLGDAQFDEDRAAAVARAREAGVAHVVIVAESLDATTRARSLAAAFGLSATAGVHPHEASSWTPDAGGRIEEALGDGVVVAVGETGLDYHYDHSPRDVQRRVFGWHLALGERLGYPVVVHSRSADEDMAAMLRDTRATVVMHSFSSGSDVLRAALDIDAYVSFSGMVTFRSWTDREAVTAVPGERLLVETDAPYLAPTPHRGRRNEPAFVVNVAAGVAALRGGTAEEVARITTANATRCFGLSLDPTPAHDHHDSH